MKSQLARDDSSTFGIEEISHRSPQRPVSTDFMAAHDAAAVGNTCCEKIVLSIFNARGYVAHKESREEIT
jgi:hypothetical protein